MTTKPPEPDWNSLIDVILEMDDEDRDVPTGLQERYLSQHARNIAVLDVFHWPEEWVKGRPVLLLWLTHEFEHWWEGQAHEDEGFRGWLDGDKITIHGDAYITELNLKLLALYRERITETYTCSDCGKEASEKHPYGHPDKATKFHIVGEDAKLVCGECWNKRHPHMRRR